MKLVPWPQRRLRVSHPIRVPQLVPFTWLVRGRFAYLVDRYSERVETDAEALLRVVKL